MKRSWRLDMPLNRSHKSAMWKIAPVATGLVATVACLGDTTNVKASKMGDLSNAPAVRGDTLDEFTTRCGPGGPSARGVEVLERKPYVQRTTSTGTEVVFRTSTSDPPIVDVTTPEGDRVASLTARRDPAADGQWVAAIDGLEGNTFYCYALRDLTMPVGFRTAPNPGGAETIRFAVFGDSGSRSRYQRAVADELARVPFDLLLHTGDVDYSGGSANYDRTFFDFYGKVTESIPAFPVTGNHDYETDRAAPFFEAFRLPENGGPEGVERWYSFDWGDVHFVALDTELDADAQVAWLERDLSANALPWVVVYLHRPPFSSGNHGSDRGVRKAFVPVFERHSVDVVLAGHEHNYERTAPINGVTYVVTGGGGKSTRTVGWSSFTAFSEDALHFVVGEVSGETMVLHAIDGTGVEFDSVKLSRGS